MGDGLFAEALQNIQNRILTAYDVKIAGDPPIDLLHSWRKKARVGGIDYGQVFCSITKRNGSTTRLRVRLVESPERPLDLLFERARMRIYRMRRHAFGPYILGDVPKDRCVPLGVHRDLLALCPQVDVRQALVPVRGGILTEEGKIRSVRLENSVIWPSDGHEEMDGVHEGNWHGSANESDGRGANSAHLRT